MSNRSSSSARLTAFVNFPSPYTQNLILQALTSLIPNLSLTLVPPCPGEPTPQLQWCDYDLLCLDDILSNPTSLLISAYIYRKTLIRKHLLHTAVQEHLAKQKYRGHHSVLEKSIPKGNVIDITFADELDEMLADELYEVKAVMDANEEIEEIWRRKWFLLKPGMSDKGQGIRLFSTESELRNILESFDPASDDEDEDDEGETGGNQEEQNTSGSAIDPDLTIDPKMMDAIKKMAVSAFPNDEDYVERNSAVDEEEEDGTGVRMSQLRHWVIQEYLPRPLLFDPLAIGAGSSASPQAAPHKFHLRAYVLLTGTYQLYLSRTMLALFSDQAYSLPGSVYAGSENEDEQLLDLRPHLSNTCLQVEGRDTPPDHLVHLFWDLANSHGFVLDATDSSNPNAPNPRGAVSEVWLESTFQSIGKVIAEAVQAGTECGGFGLQLLPNAFEIFGVDLMLSMPEKPTPSSGELPPPLVSLLEFNAGADFTQSGDNLKGDLLSMFKGVVEVCIAPFFDIRLKDEEEEDSKDEESWEVGQERFGFVKIGEEKTRGDW